MEPYYTMARHNVTGKIGEDLAVKWLTEQGHEIVARNYLKKWGELDVITEYGGKIHFVEVKAVSYETKEHLHYAVSRGTFRPEELVHRTKLKKAYRAIETWIAEKRYTGEWQIDVLTVRMVPRDKYAQVNFIENVTTDRDLK